MEEALKDLCKVVGVFGAFVNNEKGEMVSYQMPPGYSTERLSDAGRSAIQGFQGIESIGHTIGEIEWEYDESLLIVRKIKKSLISVLCSKTISLPLLNLTFNLVAKKVEDHLDAKPVKKKVASGPVVNGYFFSTLDSELAKEVGPIARILIDEKVAKMGENRQNFPHSKARDLIDNLSKEIGGTGEKEQFEKAMYEVLNKYKGVLK